MFCVMDDVRMRYEKLAARIELAKGRKCDKYDYMIAVFCGVSAAAVDILFVNKPTNSILGDHADRFSNEMLEKIADKQIRRDTEIREELLNAGVPKRELPVELKKRGIPENLSPKGYPGLKDKITYLENKYRVPYDQSVNVEQGISPKNHHLKSLSHCPDIIGLIASILDQFAGTSTFIVGGKLIRTVPSGNGVELRGTTFISKLFCAFTNWLGHILSDFCGSHSATGRGMGIPIPFFEAFLFCDFGSFLNDQGGNMTFTDAAVKAFESGYDARFAMAMAVPAVMCDLSIRLVWMIKQRFCHGKPWDECVPTDKHASLRMMLLVGNGALCIVDGADAFIKSRGNIVEFILHLNMIAWFRLAKRALKEVLIQYAFDYADLKTMFEYLNQQMDEYIEKLRKVDYCGYELQMQELSAISELVSDNILDASEDMSTYIKKHNIDSDFADMDEAIAKLMDSSSIIKF